MAVYYRETEAEPSFLESMLSSGLQAYQQKKQQTNQAVGLGQLLGLEGDQLNQFANMSPEAQQQYLKSSQANAATAQKNQLAQNNNQQLMQLMGIGGVGSMVGGDEQAIGQEQPTQQSVQQPTQAPKRYTQDQINAATIINPNAGKAMQAQNDAVDKSVQAQNVSADKALERKAALNNKANESYFSSISAKAESLPRKQSALLAMTNALEGGDLGFFSRDNLAELTNVEGLRSAKGAEFISAGKDFFMGALKDSGGRPNMFLENKISEMLPKVGRSNEANLTVAELLKTENAIQEKQIDLTYELANELESTLGYVPRDLSKRVNEQLKPFVQQQQDLLEERVREITGEVKLNKVEKGTPIDKDIAQKILAKANGDKDKARTIAKGLGYEF